MGKYVMSDAMNNHMDQAPLVTIGMPVYNGERFLRATIDSLLVQTFTDFEIVICDNASTDATADICQSVASKDPRIRYYRNEINIGAVKNHRRVLELARGKYFRWASANDVCRPILLERCVAVLETHPEAVIAFGLTTLINDDDSVIEEYKVSLHLDDKRPGDRFIKYLSRVGLINQFAGLIRTEALRRARPMGDYIASDVVLLAELALQGEFFEIQEPLFLRRMSRSASTQWKTMAELKQFYNPLKKRRLILPLWRQQGELFRVILRSDIPAGDKCKAGWFVFKCFYWRRSPLAAEIAGAMSQITRREKTVHSGHGGKVNSLRQPPKE